MQTVTERVVKIPPVGIHGDLMLPARAHGIVLFANGSGSTRHNPGNRHVAGILQEGGFATLLLDLLTEAEEEVDLRTNNSGFDIGLLAGRLGKATDWLQGDSTTQGLRVGYFGAGTGGGAVLVAAAERRAMIGAVVSRGGRPDLAGTSLRHLKAPTLLIVGGADKQSIELNRKALFQMQCEKELAMVPGSSNLLEEPGALEQLSDLALDWFQRHFSQSTARR